MPDSSSEGAQGCQPLGFGEGGHVLRLLAVLFGLHLLLERSGLGPLEGDANTEDHRRDHECGREVHEKTLIRRDLIRKGVSLELEERVREDQQDHDGEPAEAGGDPAGKDREEHRDRSTRGHRGPDTATGHRDDAAGRDQDTDHEVSCQLNGDPPPDRPEQEEPQERCQAEDGGTRHGAGGEHDQAAGEPHGREQERSGRDDSYAAEQVGVRIELRGGQPIPGVL